ncbi:hypothetical protein ACFSR7_06250 [Cohnella sp. GCM10020058]|uniref:hypothetical protein n=1 Tax=Cohnella sp. GCM10020058 TaxID=3317330 RepID=UPI00364282B7
MARIQLLASDKILHWWQQNEKNKHRQEKLREATEAGIQIIEGQKVAVDSEKVRIYEALEVLINSGVFVNGTIPNRAVPEPEIQALIQSVQQTAVEEKKPELPPDPPKPDFDKLTRLRRSSMGEE